MNKHEKTIRIITIILGAVMIISGIILITYSHSHTGVEGGVSRASTSIEFGADYYTTSAQYMGLAANAACNTYSLIKICFSLVFVFAGTLIILKEINQLLSLIKNENELKSETITQPQNHESEDEKE